MLRTRKKDINLKPNRILDKKSSRGMLYENEELRLRTIHINDEVDKGQNSIRKLKKENEHLKREIWVLRDECEKLEIMLKKVFIAVEKNGTPLESLELSPNTRNSMLEQFDLPSCSSIRELKRESSFDDSEEEINEEQLSYETNGESRRAVPRESQNGPTSVAGALEVEILEDTSNSEEYCPPSEIFAPETPPLLPPIIEITPASLPEDAHLASTTQDLFGHDSIPENNRITTEVFVEPHQHDGNDLRANTIHASELSNATQKRRKSFVKACLDSKNVLGSFEISNGSQSEPNLSFFEESFDLTKFSSPIKSNYFRDWDPNVLIGHVETGNGVSGKVTYKLTDFRVEEVIDELEKEMGSQFSEVTGVRLLASSCPIMIIIYFSTSTVFQFLAEKGLMELRNGNVRVRLVEANKKWSFVHLYLLPPQIPDTLVIRVLNQYGQVVGPLERTFYKGIDICERVARMYVCKKLPQVLNVGGYESPAKISSQGQHSINRASTYTSVIIQDQILTRNYEQNSFDNSRSVMTMPNQTNEPALRKVQRVKRAISSAPVLQTQSNAGVASSFERNPTTQSSLFVDNPTDSLPTRSSRPPKLGTATEVSFFRSLSHPNDAHARRRSSASRFHLNNNNVIKDNEDSSMFEIIQSQNKGRIVKPSKIQNPRNSTHYSKNKELPWFSCFGNGCI